MQIRLTVLGPRGGQSCDVLVTAPTGTAVGKVSGAIAASAGGGQHPRSGAGVALFVGAERVPEGAVLGHPPLVDGAVVALQAGVSAPGLAESTLQLRVVGGPDAGGVHLLHGGPVRVGRSAQAEVVLDDPDVSRLHAAVTLDEGRVTVADLGSTNGTAVDEQPVGTRAVPLRAGELLRVGESTLVVELPRATGGEESSAVRPASPDGEGHLQVRAPAVLAPPAVPPADPAPAAGSGSRAMALARRLATGRSAQAGQVRQWAEQARAARERHPDPAGVLLTALGPGPRLWERAADHPDALTVRLGLVDEPAVATPVTVALREAGVFGLAGPAARVRAVARNVVAQLAALHAPSDLELVLLAAGEELAEEWAWLRWLPQCRPAQGQDCRLLLGLDADQQQRRVAEVTERLAGPVGRRRTVLVVDESSGRQVHPDLAGLHQRGAAAGVFVLHVAAAPEQLPAACVARAVLTGEVATHLEVALPDGSALTGVVADGVSSVWAERFGRALAPLREAEGARPRSALPESARLLDALELALATPAKVSARWAELPATGGGVAAVLGASADGRCAVDLAGDGPHLLVGGAPGSGKTELLRSVAASLAAADRPDRLALVLVDGAGEGLRVCTDLPHVSTYLGSTDPVRMRELAQALTGELARRERLLDGRDFAAWQAEHLLTLSRVPSQVSTTSRTSRDPQAAGARTGAGRAPGAGAAGGAPGVRTEAAPARLVVLVDDFDALVAPALGSPGRPSAGSVVRALDAVARRGARLGVHLVVATGRPEQTSGGEVDEQARLRIALRTDDPVSSRLLVHVEDAAGLDEAVPGRGYLRRPDGSVVPFQAGRVSGRIPRTATLRPTVVPLDWLRMGDPPTRRPVRELGNGPTDLALLASALQRAAESVDAAAPAPLV